MIRILLSLICEKGWKRRSRAGSFPSISRGTAPEDALTPGAATACKRAASCIAFTMSLHHDSNISADEALARLEAGNARFLAGGAGAARFPTIQKEILADLAKGQH